MKSHFVTFMGFRPYGRHSMVLLVAGSIYIGIGFTYTYLPERSSRYQALLLAREWMSMPAWGVIFTLIGIGAIISSRWPVFYERWGYMLLTGHSAAWGGFYALGSFFVDDVYIRTAVSGALVWAMVAFLWWAISGLSNPDASVVVLDGRD